MFGDLLADLKPGDVFRAEHWQQLRDLLQAQQLIPFSLAAPMGTAVAPAPFICHKMFGTLQSSLAYGAESEVKRWEYNPVTHVWTLGTETDDVHPSPYFKGTTLEITSGTIIQYDYFGHYGCNIIETAYCTPSS